MTPSKPICVLKKRSDFLSVASARRKWVTPAFIVQIAPRNPHGDEIQKGLGLTTSKKMVGTAVERNRARRRLRALAREVIVNHAAASMNYVLIARRDALSRDFDLLKGDLGWALQKLGVWQK